VAGVEDITIEHLVTLKGLLTAIKDGDTTPEDAFSAAPAGARPERQPYTDDAFAAAFGTWRKVVESGKKSPEDIIAMAESKGVLSDDQKSAIRKMGEPATAGAAEGEPA